MKTGSCLCGAVAFTVNGALRPIIACHCIQCRKQTGSYMSATACADDELSFSETRGLKWYRSSSEAQRGFCMECGSVLFWKKDGSDAISISAGSIDGPTGAPLEGHIFCESAGDYYEIAGGHTGWTAGEDRGVRLSPVKPDSRLVMATIAFAR